jgi:hypothetical protein
LPPVGSECPVDLDWIAQHKVAWILFRVEQDPKLERAWDASFDVPRISAAATVNRLLRNSEAGEYFRTIVVPVADPHLATRWAA